jgi:DNA-directed RNA polymerase subunit RPC12/RpoP
VKKNPVEGDLDQAWKNIADLYMLEKLFNQMHGMSPRAAGREKVLALGYPAHVVDAWCPPPFLCGICGSKYIKRHNDGHGSMGAEPSSYTCMDCGSTTDDMDRADKKPWRKPAVTPEVWAMVKELSLTGGPLSTQALDFLAKHRQLDVFKCLHCKENDVHTRYGTCTPCQKRYFDKEHPDGLDG